MEGGQGHLGAAASSAAPGADATVELLRDTAAALASAATTDEVLQRCVEAIVGRLEMAFARVWTLERDRAELVLRASALRYGRVEGFGDRIPLGAPGIGRLAAERRAHLTNDAPTDERLPNGAWIRQEGMVAFAGYPLVAGDELVGVLALFARQPIEPWAQGALGAVADSLALGIRRTRAEEVLREQGEVVEMLYRVGTTLAQARRLDAVVQTATDAATKLTHAEFGAFLYNVVGERGKTYTLYALSGVDREAFAGFGLPGSTPVFDPTFRGQSVVRSDDITGDERYGHVAPHFGLPAGHPPVRSYLAVPVTSATGDVLGGLLFGHAGVDVFDDRAERIAVGIAGHAATAIDGVRLYEAEHRLAVSFQRTLLAHPVPEVPGVQVAARYVPASDYAAVGGDWYDVIALAEGGLAITVGDVVGHDLRAAATMGRLRNAVQLHAVEGQGPAETLDRVERFMRLAGIDDLATVVHARFDPARKRLSVSRAGHLPPLILDPGGDTHWVELSALPGPMLGIGSSRRPRRTAHLQLESGSAVVFITDGLIENRGETLDDGMERLARAVEAGPHHDPEALCDHLLERLVGAFPADDVALVVLAVD